MRYLHRHGEVYLFLVVLVFAGLWGFSWLFPPLSLPQKSFLAVALLAWIAGCADCLFRSEFPFFRKHSPAIGLTVLVVYVVMLGLATAAEIFDLNWFSWL